MNTSLHQPDGKYLRTVNEYLGALDEETGIIIPKKSKAETDRFLDDDCRSGKGLDGS
jgi:hypothetical protein